MCEKETENVRNHTKSRVFGANAFRIFYLFDYGFIKRWNEMTSMNERTSGQGRAHTHTHMSTNRNKLSRLCSRTLQKWRLATIYPDSVFINTNAYILPYTNSHTYTHHDDDGVYGRPKSNPFIHIKFSKYYIPIIKHTPLPMASSYTHSDTHHYRSYLFHMVEKV